MNLMLTITKELESLAKSFIHHHANKITTLYYGVKQPDKFLDENSIKQQREKLGFSEDDFIVGLIGRLEEGKGQHLLIDSIAIAARAGHSFKALIVGHEMQPGYHDRLESMAAEKNIAGQVVFMDFVSDPQKLMQLCDCIVLASYSETFGLVLPEAMRCNRAVIGSNSGGVPEIIEHGKTGLLFESHNASSLYQQLVTLHDDTTLRENLAKLGRQKADSIFNSNVHFRTLEKYFEKLTG